MAKDYLEDHPKVHRRFEQVASVVKGFETPFGMELLSTVDWVARYESAGSPEEAMDKTYQWSDRKRMFTEKHIRAAWHALEREHWLPQR